MPITKKLNRPKWPLFAILSFCLISCATQPPDVAVFEDMPAHLGVDPVTNDLILKPSPTCMAKIQETECGHGVYIMSGREVFIGENSNHLFNNKPWSVLKTQSILVPAVESYAPLEAYVIDSCKKDNCNVQVDAFKVKLDSLNGITNAISSH